MFFEQGDEFWFNGSGTDDGIILACEWVSDIDGVSRFSELVKLLDDFDISLEDSMDWTGRWAAGTGRPWA